MPQRSDQRTSDADVSSLLDDSDAPDAQSRSESTGGAASRVKRRAGRFFAPKTFLAALALLFAGMFVGQAVVPVFDRFGGFLGVFAAAFALGVLKKESCILEAGAAGAVAMGVSWLLGNVVLAFASGIGLPLGAVSAGGGLVVAALGAYFGGDLRDGLSQEI